MPFLSEHRVIRYQSACSDTGKHITTRCYSNSHKYPISAICNFFRQLTNFF